MKFPLLLPSPISLLCLSFLRLSPWKQLNEVPPRTTTSRSSNSGMTRDSTLHPPTGIILSAAATGKLCEIPSLPFHRPGGRGVTSWTRFQMSTHLHEEQSSNFLLRPFPPFLSLAVPGHSTTILSPVNRFSTPFYSFLSKYHSVTFATPPPLLRRRSAALENQFIPFLHFAPRLL